MRKSPEAHWKQVTADPESLVALHRVQFATKSVQGEHYFPPFFLKFPTEHMSQVLLPALQVTQNGTN